MKRRVVSERTLLEHSHCPIRLVQLPSEKRLDPFLHIEESATTELYRRNVLKCFEDGPRPADLGDMRLQYEALVKNLPGEAPIKAVRFGVRAAKRVRDVLAQFQIYQPDTPYVLNFGKYGIHGSYSVLCRPRKPELLVARLRFQDEMSISPFMRTPDVVSMARWLHLRFQEPGALIRLLNIVVDEDKSWEEEYSEAYVRKWLNSILLNYGEDRHHALPGPHCDSCTTRSCEQVVFSVQRHGFFESGSSTNNRDRQNGDRPAGQRAAKIPGR